MTMIYDWTRYWYSAADEKFDSDKGFLNDFDIAFERCKVLEAFEGIPCLILLGAPGTGKSFEARREAKQLNLKSQSENDVRTLEAPVENAPSGIIVESLYVNLGSIQDIVDLYKELFESEIYGNWENGEHNLYLFLDSLDEALMQINTLTLKLFEKLNALPTEAIGRLFLRIACRPAEWTQHHEFQEKLMMIWNADQYLELQLAPLSENNVILAATANEIDEEIFLREIYEKEIANFASDPTTLDMLMNEFKKNSSLPAEQSTIYEKGCLIYCEETAGRIEAGRATGLAKEEKLLIGGRIAALTTFCNKEAIWNAIDTGEHSDRDIFIDTIPGYFKESAEGREEFEVTRDRVEIALDTRLFIKSIGSRLKWRTRRISDYLVSKYLSYREISDDLIIELLGGEHLPPQLYEVAALLAKGRERIFNHLMVNSPLVLLRSEIFSTSESLRERLVAELLTIFEREESRDENFRRYYPKLRHKNLASQLRPFIVDQTKGKLARRAAIDIAEATKLIEVQKELADVALSKDDDLATRINAAYAVVEIADRETRRRLKELIYEENDENNELKGRGLAANWRENMTADELFGVLETPSEHFTGSYQLFLYRFAEKLQPEDLPVALNWLKNKIATEGESIRLERISDDILFVAWSHLESEQILSGVAQVLLEKLRDHKELFSGVSAFSDADHRQNIERITNDITNRRKIWKKTLTYLGEEDFWIFRNSRFIYIGAADLDWLVNEWIQEIDPRIKEILLEKFKGFVFPYGEVPPDVLSKIIQLCNDTPALGQELRDIFAERILNSEEADREKAQYDQYFGWQKAREKPGNEEELMKPSPTERTLEFLNNLEQGKIDAWWQINYFMMFLPNGRSKYGELESDLTKLPVWKELGEENQSRIIEAAKLYLDNGDPQNEKWIGTNTIHRPAFAGYRAITLLRKFAGDFLEKLNRSVWQKWAAIIYFYPVYNGSGEEEYERHLKLIADAYRNAPDFIIEILGHEIEDKGDEYWTFEKLKYCWDERLLETLRSKANDPTLSILTVGKILTKLFEENDSYAEEFTCKQIKYPPTDDRQRQLLVLSVELLFRFGKTACWDEIWEIFSADPEFGSMIIEEGVLRFGRLLPSRLTEKQVADFYIWLSTNYPHNEDPVHLGVFSPGPRDEVIGLRESFLTYLMEKGTVDAVAQFSRVIDELPHLEGLKTLRTTVIEKMREKTWIPFTPHEVLRKFSLEILKNRISSLKSELIPFEKADRLATRISKFRVNETLALTILVAVGWIFVVLYCGFDKMGFWTWVVSLFISVLSVAIPIWSPRGIYFSLKPDKALAQEKEKLYLKNGLSPNKFDYASKELEAQTKSLESANKGFGTLEKRYPVITGSDSFERQR